MKLSLIILLVQLMSSTKIYSQQDSLRFDELIDYSFIINGKSNSEFQTSGTGSILKYKDKFYLITNFHVLTGKDSKTNEKFPDLKDTNSAISIIFQNADRKSKFIVIIYPIYNSKGEELFRTYMFKNQIIDISVLPIDVPEKVLKSFFEINDLDTTWSYEPDKKVSFWGFPNGNFKNSWQPTEMTAKTVRNSQVGEFIFDPYVFFDNEPIKGMSGSPLYIIDNDNKIKFLSVVSNVVDDNPKIKGRSVYSLCALQLIKKMYEEKIPSVIGEEYDY